MIINPENSANIDKNNNNTWSHKLGFVCRFGYAYTHYTCLTCSF